MALLKGYKNINKSDIELDKEKGCRSYIYKKYRDLAKKGLNIYKLVIADYNNNLKDKDLLNIKAQYAHDNKAKYWSPQPSQFKGGNK